MLLFLCIFVVCLGLLLLVADPAARVAALWSATWGIVAGVWIVAPRLLEIQRIAVRGLWSWLSLEASLLLAFGAIGALLGIVGSAPITAIRMRRPHPSRNPVWLNALWPGAALPFLYLGSSKTIEWVGFGRFEPLLNPGPVVIYLTLHLLVVTALALAYRRSALDGGRAADRLWRALAAAAALGLVALPYRGPAIENAATRVPLLRPEGAPPPPLLVIGLDGGNWRTIQPLVDGGLMPNLARLVKSGAAGDMQAKWPPYWSAPAWASMITGHDEDETGVHEDLAAYAPLLPAFELSMQVDPLLNPVYALEYALLRGGLLQTMPATRQMLRRIPVWERLSAAGVRTAVIRFPFTYPAIGQADLVVSNRTVTDLWDMIGVRTGEDDALVWPRALADRWLPRLNEPESVDERIVRTLVDRANWPQPSDAPVDPLSVLRRAVHVQRLMHDVTLESIRQPMHPQVVMLYIAGLDNLSHAFWPYRHPEDYRTMPPMPAPADVEQLGPVIDRYMVWLDRQIGELVAAFPTEPNVLIVSDHGEGATNAATLWRGWHTAQGIFIASGPSVRRSSTRVVAQYTDVAPTMLELLNLRPAPDLNGHGMVVAQRGESGAPRSATATSLTHVATVSGTQSQ